MNVIIRILITALTVLIIASFLPGVQLAGYGSAIWVAIVLGLLNITVKPLLIFFTLPATIITAGLFLFVINAVVILMTSSFIDGFYVSGFWAALLFSVLLTLLESVLFSFFEKE
ncbi:MAG: phage holin family protein [Flavobacteriaceae bacterium]|nr:phage holin family protein [Flavobacteriaceae bacterium]